MNAERVPFAAHDFAELAPDPFPRRRALWRGVEQIGMPADRKHPPQIAACFHDIAGADRLALGAVGIEQAVAAPALDHGGELPRQIDRVADAGVHAKAAGGRHDMRGVAGDKAAAVAVALGDQFAPHPRQHAQDLEFEVAADGAADRGLDLLVVYSRCSAPPISEKRHSSRPLIATMVAQVPSGPMKMWR